MNDFAGRLRQLRKSNGLTQEQLRTRLDRQGYEISSVSTISRWENGSRRPKAEIVEALEDVLQVNRGVLLRAARYLVEQSLDEPVSPQIDSVAVIQRAAHFAELADIAKSLLANGLDSVSCPGWSTNRSRQAKYLLPSDTAASEYNEITKEQLASRLDSNTAALTKENDWLFRHCFIPHLKSELPEELGTKLFFKTIEEQPYELIETLRVLAARGIFKGTCPACEDWH